MVTNITSLTGNGLKDWLIQRATAVYLLGYALVFLGWYLTHPQFNYEQWIALFNCPWFAVASFIAFLSITLHAWIGIWTVTTDYLKCTILRLSIQLLVALWLLGQLIWSIMIVWGR